MEPKVKVSVIVPVYNNRQYLEQCINSILCQTLKDIEIILVDDGSTDPAVAPMLDEYSEFDGRVRVTHQKNRGAGYAVNLGLDMASGKYVAQVDCDDWLEPNMYEELYRKAELLDLDVIRCDFFADGTPVHSVPITAHTIRDVDIYADINRSEKDNVAILGMNAPMWPYIFRKNFIDGNRIRMSETPGANFQDTGFTLQARILARRLGLYDVPLYHYRWDNQASASHNISEPMYLVHEFAKAERCIKEHDLPKMWKGFARVKLGTYSWMYSVLEGEQQEKWEKVLNVEMKSEVNLYE